MTVFCSICCYPESFVPSLIYLAFCPNMLFLCLVLICVSVSFVITTCLCSEWVFTVVISSRYRLHMGTTQLKIGSILARLKPRLNHTVCTHSPLLAREVGPFRESENGEQVRQKPFLKVVQGLPFYSGLGPSGGLSSCSSTVNFFSQLKLCNPTCHRYTKKNQK